MIRRSLVLCCVLLGSIGSAFADCQGDLQVILHGNVNAGPYGGTTRIEKHNVSDGKSILNVEINSKVVLPDAMESRIHDLDNYSAKSSAVVAIKGSGWKFDGDSWHELPKGYAAHALKNIANAGYVVGPVNNVGCTGMQKMNGNDVLSFKFDWIANPSPIQIFHILMYVDPSTKRPLYFTGESYDGKVATHMSSSFVFDPKLEIVPPPGF